MANTADSSRSYASDILRSCFAGSAFGVALTLARVYLPGVIIDQMRLKDFHMLEVFLSATSLSSIVFLSLEKFGISKRVTRANSRLAIFGTNYSHYDGNILGGILIGSGMALAGACPGTVIIQLAQGLPIARITTLGAILGGTLWVWTADKVIHSSQSRPDKVASSSNETKQSPESSDTTVIQRKPVFPPGHQQQEEIRITISEALNTNPTVTYVGFLLLMSATIAASVMFFPGKSQAIIPTVLAGGLVAASQAISLSVASTPLGTSAAYEQIGRYIARAVHTVTGAKRPDLPPFPPKSVVFAVGMALGSIFVTAYEDLVLAFLLESSLLREVMPLSFVSTASNNAVSPPVVHIPKLQALIGGVALSYGARMAGGCTSGHGISGLSSLSWASLISVMSMFGGGIAVRLALDTIGL